MQRLGRQVQDARRQALDAEIETAHDRTEQRRTIEQSLLLIDAHEGVQENSRRHGYLLHLLGIKPR